MEILMPAKRIVYLLAVLAIAIGCKTETERALPGLGNIDSLAITHAEGFRLQSIASDITILEVMSPWPDSDTSFRYALVPKERLAMITLDRDAYDAIVPVPVERLVVTSTTHIPALEALQMEHTLVGFPETRYISSERTRDRIEDGHVLELGNNESINTERLLELRPEVVVGFSIDGRNPAYATLERAGIPVLYNGEWAEPTPLGKAEWIKFFAALYHMDAQGAAIFQEIEDAYQTAKALAQNTITRPTVLSGALFKDVWYLPGGKSWAAQFLSDANAHYLWEDTRETGSLSLSIESVLDKAREADYWIGPSQFTSYSDMDAANRHYRQFAAFQNKAVYTFAKTRGATDGLLYYELGPHRPDLILKDLVHILHPEVLPSYRPFFFKPLD